MVNDIDELVSKAASVMDDDPIKAAEEFDKGYQRLAENWLTVRKYMDAFLLNLAAEFLYFRACQKIGAELDIFDGQAENLGRRKIDDFVPADERERELALMFDRYNKSMMYFGHAFSHEMKSFGHYVDEPVSNTDDFTPLREGSDIFVLNTDIPGMDKIIGKLVFRKSYAYPENFMQMMKFYRGVIGIKKIAPPIDEARGRCSRYFVIPQGADDLDIVIRDRKLDASSVYTQIGIDLMRHTELQRKLRDHSDVTEKGNIVKIPYNVFGEMHLQEVLMPTHDYFREIEESMIVGRDTDKRQRLAKEEEYVTREGIRHYKKGSNKMLDDLMEEGRHFAQRFLIVPELAEIFTNLADHDSQPSNYLVNGQLIDMTKVQYGTAIYTAARLLGHPVVHDFLNGIDSKKREEMYYDMIRYAEEHGEIDLVEAARFLDKNPRLIQNDDYHFALFITRKIIDNQNSAEAKHIVEMQGAINRMYETLHAHKMWINAFHVFSRYSRADDLKTAFEHLDTSVALAQQTPEHMKFMLTYTKSIMQGPHDVLKERLQERCLELVE